MTQRSGSAFSHDFAARGRALAEGRLAHLTELYDSGRWRRFFSEVDFLLNVREAKAAVAAWCSLEPEPVELRPTPPSRPAPPPRRPAPIVPEAIAMLISARPAVEEAAEAAEDDVVGQGILADYMTERGWPRPASRLPPITFSTQNVSRDDFSRDDVSRERFARSGFSTDGIRTERDLSEA